MFFRINAERKIGYKELSEADLGLGTSHQTHIGLYQKDGMLSFLKDEDFTNAILIYDNYCEVLPCDFDRIKNPDGTFRSPKIRLGTDGYNTVVRQIRTFTSKHPDRTYYLIWFGLDNNELLFWLLDNKSRELGLIQKEFPTQNTVYGTSQKIIEYLENKVDDLSISIQAELEVISQTTGCSRKYKSRDIEKARAKFEETGKAGEILINQYLETLKEENKISNFIWENRSRESYKPFDFIINPCKSDEKFIDVKSTSYYFEQPVFFSDGEIDFITHQNEKKYSIYRVYSMYENKKFKICSNCIDCMTTLNSKIIDFKKQIDLLKSAVRQINLTLTPDENNFKLISSEISL